MINTHMYTFPFFQLFIEKRKNACYNQVIKTFIRRRYYVNDLLSKMRKTNK